jgi:hypothetical protein
VLAPARELFEIERQVGQERAAPQVGRPGKLAGFAGGGEG